MKLQQSVLNNLKFYVWNKHTIEFPIRRNMYHHELMHTYINLPVDVVTLHWKRKWWQIFKPSVKIKNNWDYKLIRVNVPSLGNISDYYEFTRNESMTELYQQLQEWTETENLFN